MTAFLLYIIFIILGFFFPRCKFMFGIQWIYLSIMMCFNMGGPDIEPYYQMYKAYSKNMVSFLTPESLYHNLIYLFYNGLGFDFYQFTMITSMVGMLILAFVIVRNSTCPAMVFSFIMIYPGFDLVIQIRNFLGVSFLLLGMHFLLNSNKYKIFKYTISILISIGFHSVFFIYLIMPLFFTFNTRFFRGLMSLYLLSASLIIYFTPIIMYYIMPASKFDLYFNNDGFHFSRSLFFVMLHVLFIFISFGSVNNNINLKDNRDLVKKLFYFSLLAIPLYFFDSTFFRVYRNLLPFMYMFVFYNRTLYYFNNGLIIDKKVLYLLILILTYSMLIYTSGHGWEYIVKPLFIENSAFELINL